jgi:hypothetical protein
MSDKGISPPYPVLRWIKSPDGICEVYANAVHVTWTQDDVRIRLGQLVNDPETPNPGTDSRSERGTRGDHIPLAARQASTRSAYYHYRGL